MRILITTGIYPPQIGGPAQYSYNLSKSLREEGFDVKVKTYGLENYLPTGIRHIYFFLKIIPSIFQSDFCITLDTFSVGFPSVLAGKLLRKKVIVRTGGDFLWEKYLERTKNKILFKNFYIEKRNFSIKEKIIFKLTKWTLKNSDAIVFSTEWQRKVWFTPYDLSRTKTFIIENFYGGKINSNDSDQKIFLGSSRRIQFKNLDLLKEAFNKAKELDSQISLDLENYKYDEFLEKIKNCYSVILVSLGDISPNFITDAMRFNKPFILTKENGINDRIGDIALLVDPLNISEIAEKITWLSKSENYKIQKRKIEGFNFTHSWKEIAKEFISVYENI